MMAALNLRVESSFRRVREMLVAQVGNAKYFGIVLGLLAVGYAGHKTHWTFGNTNHVSEQSHDVVPDVTALKVQAESNGWKIEFPSEKSLRRSGIKTYPIEHRSIREQVKTTGVIAYDERKSATLSARASGTVWRVIKQAGDPVKRGDVLVIIDAADVGRAKAEFLSELVAVESKSAILASRETISDVISRRLVQETQVAVREARIRLQNAEQKLINLGLAIRKEAFEKLNDAERAAKLQFIGLPASIVKDLDPEQVSSNLFALSASFDGVLIHNDAATGEMVEAGKPVLEIADMRQMWLKLDVPKEDASKLALGQAVRFCPDGIDQVLESKISWISTEMNEQTRTLQIRAEVDNPIVSSIPASGHEVRLLRAHTFGTGTVSLGEATSAFVVPVSAILHAEEQPMVFVQVGELSFKRVNVKLGLREGQMIQIESPELQPQMCIVSQGSHVLKSEWILNHVASVSP